MVLLLGLTVACGGEPPIPADFETTWSEVRTCDQGTEHDAVTTRIFVNDIAEPVWKDWADRVAASGNGALPAGEMIEFPEGSVLLMEEYSGAACTGSKRWTKMTRLSGGVDVDNGNWRFETISADEDGDPDELAPGGDGCFVCHGNYRRYDYAGNNSNVP